MRAANQPFSATVVMHPAHSDFAAFCRLMNQAGYTLRARQTPGGWWVTETRPRETAHSNASVVPMIHRKRQYGHSALPDGGPDGPEAA